MRSYQTAATALILSILGASQAVAVEGVERETVTVDGTDVRPVGGGLDTGGSHVIHPKAMLGLGYDSNVFAVENGEEDDVYGRAIAGVVGRWELGVSHLIEYDVELEGQVYADVDDSDMLGGRGDIEWAYEGLANVVNTSLSYNRFDDPLIETGEQKRSSEATPPSN